MKETVIPLVRIGPGSQPEGESLEYLPMPREMNAYQPPRLPEPEDLVGFTQARAVLEQLRTLLEVAVQSGTTGTLPLNNVPPADLAVVNEVLGEGEASAVLEDADHNEQIRIQESVFAGVWRLVTLRGERVVDDRLEVAPIPTLLYQVAAQDSETPPMPWQHDVPDSVQNAPAIVDEVRHHVEEWSRGDDPHVINLTLLPVTPEDIAFLDNELGTGRVLILSRGYGNCRVSNTRLPNCWRVVYYNSFDKVILNTVEVVDMPAVAMAAPEDLGDSLERLADVITYVGGEAA